MMDIDDDMRQSSQSKVEEMPRRDLALAMSPGSFIIVARERLSLVSAMSDPSHSSGFIPSVFIAIYFPWPIEDLIVMPSTIARDLRFKSLVEEADASRLVLHVEYSGKIGEWRRCEVMHGTAWIS